MRVVRRSAVLSLLGAAAIAVACDGEDFSTQDADGSDGGSSGTSSGGTGGSAEGGTGAGAQPGSGGTGGTGAIGSGGASGERDAGSDASSDADSGVAGTAGANCAPAENPSGCADGTRDGFKNLTSYPQIAACSGGWSAPGIINVQPAQCCREAGNTGARPSGEGCNIEDLCSAGWHVCTSAEEVAGVTSGCDLDTTSDTLAAGSIWITRQIVSPVDGGTLCAPEGSNNVAGCGAIGVNQPCPPLNRALQNVVCSSNPPWFCGTDTEGSREAERIVKSGPENGGVLCCKDNN